VGVKHVGVSAGRTAWEEEGQKAKVGEMRES